MASYRCVVVQWLSGKKLISWFLCIRRRLGLSTCPWVRVSVRDQIRKVGEHEYTISYKPLVGMSPNLQLKCSWGHRWTDLILRSKVKVTRRQNIVKNHLFKNAPFLRRQFAVENHSFVVFYHTSLATREFNESHLSLINTHSHCVLLAL